MAQRIFFVVVLLRTPEVRHEDDRPPAVEHLEDGGDGRPDARLVRHVPLVVERHIEIHPDDGPLAPEIVIVNRIHNCEVLVPENYQTVSGENRTAKLETVLDLQRERTPRLRHLLRPHAPPPAYGLLPPPPLQRPQKGPPMKIHIFLR